MIRIVNLRNYKKENNEILIKIDRSSVLGNPYYMHNESERDEVCDKYEMWIRTTNRPVREEIMRIKKLAESNNIALGCWCFPKRCHGETIINILKALGAKVA